MAKRSRHTYTYILYGTTAWERTLRIHICRMKRSVRAYVTVSMEAALMLGNLVTERRELRKQDQVLDAIRRKERRKAVARRQEEWNHVAGVVVWTQKIIRGLEA